MRTLYDLLELSVVMTREEVDPGDYCSRPHAYIYNYNYNYNYINSTIISDVMLCFKLEL